MSASSSSSSSTIKGACLCGETRYTINDPPSNIKRSTFCHCSLCQRLNGAPYIWTTHWKKDGVTWEGKDPARFEVKTGRKWRLRCEDCGSPLGTWNSVKEQWSLWPINFERDESSKVLKHKDEDWLKPTAHMYYGTRVRDVNDDLPKWSEAEGQGERMG